MWTVLGQGFGYRRCGSAIHWIYWAPGTKTQEGEMRLEDVGFQKSAPKHIWSAAEVEVLHESMKEKGLPILQNQVQRL